MTADSKGRDIGATPVYVTGAVAYAPVASENVLTKVALGASLVSLPKGFKFLGLRTSDGGPEESRESGDATEFLETGFEISGAGSVTLAMTLAQYNAAVREFVHQVVPDANGVVEVSADIPSTPFIFYTEAVFKNGTIERQLGVAMLKEVKRQKDEKGSVKGVEVTVKWLPHELFNNKPYFEAQVGVAPVPDPGH